jgi:glycosyltransferase involved in cell wall biosynthesis
MRRAPAAPRDDGTVLHAVTPYGRTGPSSRVRVFEWVDRVDAPVAVHCYLGLANARPGALLRRPRAVLRAERDLRRLARSRPARLLLHRESSPFSRRSVERELLSNAELAVYDFDDALQWDRGEGGVLRRVAPKAPKAQTAVQLAHRVIAGNQVLADWASTLNPNVVVIPSCVDPDRYRTKDDYTIHDPPRLGWIGSPSEEKQLRFIARPLLELHRRTGARLLLVGRTDRTLGELEAMTDRVAWSEAVQATALAEMDVGLMPLVDEPMERGKCGYKLLQYGAAGVPAVASPVGANAGIVTAAGSPAPRDPAEWVDAVLGLVAASTAARRHLGRRARAMVRESYSYAAWRTRWEAAVGLRDGGG